MLQASQPPTAIMPEMSEEEQRKMEEKERKKAEVRRRLEEASKAKKGGKGGFMTPERKKKLRALLRKKAAEELKKEQERKAEERRKTIADRCGQPKNVDSANEASLQAICKEYHSRIMQIESEKYDLEFSVRQKDYQINELNIQVNDLRGKFVKPALKKVSKFDKLKVKSQKEEVDFRAGLKQVKKDFKELTDEGKPAEKPQWALGAGKKDAEAAEAEE
ncbi:troponin I-like isoform X1 [Varroa destructor]|uniref:Troponin I n=2 Tax=Varroa destructor TaxID=109461 RepID=A0A7M7KK71_VARDE|nr:troponin I-like isoform X1 [Varroa destructor]